MLSGIIEILDVAGVIAFAISGALKGLRHELDLLGVVVLGIITALGGGIIRDVLINAIPSSIVHERDMYVAIAASFVAFVASRRIHNFTMVIKVFDAAGLAVFTVIGAEKGMAAGLGFLGTIVTGTLTGVAGGMIRDLMVREIPFVLKEEVYALFCICGALAYRILILGLGLDRSAAVIIVITFIFIGRVLAIRFGWSLPRRALHWTGKSGGEDA